MQPKEKNLHEFPGKSCQIIGDDLFQIDYRNLFCVLDYFSKYIVVRKAENLATECLMACCKYVFGEHAFPKKIISDVRQVSYVQRD